MSDDSPSDETQILPKPRWTFRVKLTLLAISMSLLPVVIVGIIAIKVNQQALSEANRELLYSVIDRIANHASEDLNRDAEALSVAASTLLNQQQPLDDRLSLLKGLVGGHRLSAIAVYDEKGKWIDTIRPQNSDTNAYSPVFPLTIPETLRKTADTEKFALSAVQTSSNEGPLTATIVVKAQDSDKTWYLTSPFSFSDIQEDLEKVGHERLGQGHSLVLLDTSLTVLADSQVESVGSKVSAKQLGILKGISPNAINKGILLFGISEDRDTPMLGALRSLDGVPWGVAAEIPTSIAFYSITKIRWILSIVVALAALLALGVGVFMAKRISAPLQALARFAGELATRRFDKRIEVHTSDELNVLGHALSNAAQELQRSDKRIQKEIRIRGDLGRYLPAPLVDRIVEQEQDIRLGGERSEITVLFADVVGFTPLAETHSAEEIVSLLNELFTLMTEIVFRHKGTVDKFIGDSVMAFWGAPTPIENHAELALRAAADMQRWLEIGNEGWKERFGIEIQLAIGVNTGEAIVGNFGSSERMEYTSIGDCVNIAARLETMARPGQILVTRETVESAGESVDFRSLGSRKIVGRLAALELFEVVL